MEFVRLLLCVLSVLVALVSERFAVLAAFSQSLDSDFTFTLPPGRKECFFQTMRKDASLEIEYQVRDSSDLSCLWTTTKVVNFEVIKSRDLYVICLYRKF